MSSATTAAFSGDRHAMTTLKPPSASLRAVALPTPALAPVTTATRPAHAPGAGWSGRGRTRATITATTTANPAARPAARPILLVKVWWTEPFAQASSRLSGCGATVVARKRH